MTINMDNIANQFTTAELVKTVVANDIAALRSVEGKNKNKTGSSEKFRLFSNESNAAKALLVIKVGHADEATRMVDLGHDLIGKLIRDGNEL